MDKQELYDAGLGEKRITFVKNRDQGAFRLKLEEEYPKLVACGGFELLRTSFSNKLQLDVIRPPSSGYSAAFLADTGNLGQALCFIRPVQKNLDLTPENMEVVEEEPVLKCA